jgi:hypothetical protein
MFCSPGLYVDLPMGVGYELPYLYFYGALVELAEVEFELAALEWS